MFRVEVPGPKVSKEMADDAQVMVEIQRSHFNELATEGVGEGTTARPTSTAHIRVTGDPGIHEADRHR